jgi:hypothetical protein
MRLIYHANVFRAVFNVLRTYRCQHSLRQDVLLRFARSALGRPPKGEVWTLCEYCQKALLRRPEVPAAATLFGLTWTALAYDKANREVAPRDEEGS